VTGIKLTVLIVDDTPENIDVLSAVLEGLGCELMVATSGPRALELASRRRPDLILLDVMMPGMDGFEVCRQLKADMALAEVPVIFVTARADDISTGFAVGGADYITKPINADEVLARVRHQVERQVLLRDLRDANRSLEERVRERTAELTLANRQLRVEINERRYMQDRLNYLATHDFVTRQHNRGALDAHVSELLARIQRQAGSAVFLLIDIDQFRLVNETCGCIAGDELLRQFAELVAGALSRTDFFARTGGDKFAVVSEDQSEEFLQDHPQLLGKDPIVAVLDRAAIDRASQKGIGARLLLGRVHDRNRVQALLKMLLRIVNTRQLAEDLPGSVRREVHREGVSGAIEVIMTTTGHIETESGH